MVLESEGRRGKTKDRRTRATIESVKTEWREEQREQRERKKRRDVSVAPRRILESIRRLTPMERRAEDVVEVLVTLGSKVTNRFNNVDFTVIREQAERRESVRARERKGNKRGACLQLTQTWARSRILSPWADRREKERSQQAGKSEHQGASNLPSSKLLAKASLRLEGEP